MSSVDSLPPDQRAVLQMVLQRGYSYDDIAALLSIDRASVRRRALEALDSLGPTNSIPAPQRALLTDYLLGQLPERVAEQVRQQLGASPSDRAWARVISAQVGDLSNVPLPEIPIGSNLPDEPPAARAAAWAALADEHLAEAGAVPAAPTAPAPEAPAPERDRPDWLAPESAPTAQADWLGAGPEPTAAPGPPGGAQSLEHSEPSEHSEAPGDAAGDAEPPVPRGYGDDHEAEPAAVVPEPGLRVPEPESRVPQPEPPVPAPEARVPEPEPLASEAAPVARADKPEPAAGGGSIPPSGSSGGQWGLPSPISEPEARSQRRSSRIGGMIVLAVLAIVVVVIVVLLLNSGGNGNKTKTHTTGAGQSTTSSTPTQTTSPTTTTSTTPVSKAKVVYQVNLNPPKGGVANATGVAEVVKEGKTLTIVIVARNVPANTVRNAYAVWLYSAPTSENLLGFLDTRVGASHRLQAESQLPHNAGLYKQLLITIETQAKPKAPGKVILKGAFGT